MAVLVLLAGCVTNPVTGERELGLVGEGQERAIGEQQYVPSRQMQGGDYVVDQGVVRYVQEVGQRIAAVSDRPLDYEFAVINSSVPNAWALPGGKIAINRGLLYELDNEAQLAAVLGHEVVHAAARHGAQSMERGILLQGAVAAAAIALRDNDYSAYAVGGAQVAAALINTRYGRGAELESDRYGMIYMDRAGYDPQGAVELQETFVRLSEGRQSDWLSGLFASHPPSQARVDANRRTAAELGPGGEIGAEAYARAMQRLRATRPAYEAFDEARSLLADGRDDAAMAKVGEAIRREPREALFYGLQADIAFARGQFTHAVQRYDEAIQLNPDYFKFYLGRGESNRRLGNLAAAERDLTASAQLLPTADSLASLGQIAETRGNVSQALAYYEQAAGAATPAGRTASARLIALDLPRRPERYVPVATRVDQAGRVYLEATNRSAVPVQDVLVEFAYRGADGQVRTETRRLPGPIAPGQSAAVVLGNRYAPFYDSLQARVAKAAPGA